MSSISSVIGSIGSLSSAVSSLATTLTGGSWQESLRTASFGGVPFAVESVSTSAGRRTTIHSYPFRDTVWVEDLGKLPRQFKISGFLVENSRIYGGGGVVAQRKNLLAVAETANGQTFVHPTLGTIPNVSCIAPVEITERSDLGPVFEFSLILMQGGARVYPSNSDSTGDVVSTSALSAIASAVADFADGIAAYVTLGASIVNEVVSVATRWYSIGESAVSDVKAMIGAVSSLSGSYGRYASGGNSGYAGSNATAASTATVASVLSSNITARTAVKTAGAVLIEAAKSVSDPASFSVAATALVTAIAATATNPGDAIRLLSSMASFTPDDKTTSSVIGDGVSAVQSACGALMRRTALAQLAIASSSYQPSSSNDAMTILQSITALIDEEITIAGDDGDDSSYMALRSLRNAVVSDLRSRGAQLSAMQTFTFASSLPSLVLATRIYRDASRSDEITSEANPIHPAFLPSSFDALAT